MTVLTAEQARQRLWEQQRRRTQIQNNIQTLRQCEQRMVAISQRLDRRTISFREVSRRNQADWRGQIGTRYNRNRDQARTNARTHLQRMNAMINRLSQRRTRLSNELTSIDAVIRDLQRIANGGI